MSLTHAFSTAFVLGTLCLGVTAQKLTIKSMYPGNFNLVFDAKGQSDITLQDGPANGLAALYVSQNFQVMAIQGAETIFLLKAGAPPVFLFLDDAGQASLQFPVESFEGMSVWMQAHALARRCEGPGCFQVSNFLGIKIDADDGTSGEGLPKPKRDVTGLQRRSIGSQDDPMDQGPVFDPTGPSSEGSEGPRKRRIGSSDSRMDQAPIPDSTQQGSEGSEGPRKRRIGSSDSPIDQGPIIN